jgi:hypothetical protein
MSVGRPNPSVLVAHLEGHAVLLDLVSKDYFRLNETGALIWRAIERGDGREIVIGELVSEFDVSVEDAGRAVDVLVVDLTQRELLLPV